MKRAWFCILIFLVPASSFSQLPDGVEVSLRLDKQVYSSSDTMRAAIQIWNHGSFPFDIQLCSPTLCSIRSCIDSSTTFCSDYGFGCAAVIVPVTIPADSFFETRNEIAFNNFQEGPHVVTTTFCTSPFIASRIDTLTVSQQTAFTYRVTSGWNLIALPLLVPDNRKTALFPTSTSAAFEYDPASGYTAVDRLSHGKGYWLKFSSVQNITIHGEVILEDTIDVVPGWNMVGSLDTLVRRSTVISLPDSIILGGFYEYGSSYTFGPDVEAGLGQFVKITAPGKLIFKRN